MFLNNIEQESKGKLKKNIAKMLLFILCVSLSLISVGCRLSAEKNADMQITYSNMADEETCEDVKKALLSAGIDESRVDAFDKQLHLFNDTMPKEMLSKGYVSAGIRETLYDPYEMQDIWASKYPDFSGYNCRITAFSLYRDLIETSADAEIRKELLFIDEESLDYNDEIVKDDSDKKRFLQVFSSIPTIATKDIKTHVDKVYEYHKKNGIRFADNELVSMISVYFHDDIEPEDQKLFVGHVGVMVKAKDGVYFIEKVAFQEPYRVNKLKDVQEVKRYLLEKYDVEENQSHAKPFVMEDGKWVE